MVNEATLWDQKGKAAGGWLLQRGLKRGRSRGLDRGRRSLRVSGQRGKGRVANEIGCADYSGAGRGWLGLRGDRFRALFAVVVPAGAAYAQAVANRSWSRAIGGSRPARSAPISSRAGRPARSPADRRRLQGAVSAPACSRTCASTSPAAAFVVDRGRESGHQPHRLRGQQPGSRTSSSSLKSSRKERGTLSRAAVQSDVQRIVEVYRRSGRFDVSVDPEDHRAAEQPRRSRVRDQRRRQDQHQDDRVRRQPRLFRPIGSRTSSRRQRPTCSRSCRAATSTIPTASRRTANCCAGFISSTAISTSASSRRRPNTIPARKGFRD